MKLTPAQKLGIRWARARRWEFWPSWLFYIPVVIWILLLGLRYRSFTAFTAANPGMDEGGVVGERKSQMLLPLRANLPECTPDLRLLSAATVPAQRLQFALDFIAKQYPVVLKPNVGQRGRGVLIARSAMEVKRYLALADFDVLVQKHVQGSEYGVFIYRAPDDRKRIEIFSITAKQMLSVVGDGCTPLHALILADARARLSAALLYSQHQQNLSDIPAAGQIVHLVEVGSHCRGAVFLDACELKTEALRIHMQAIADALPDFHFGRLDIIVPEEQHLGTGSSLQVLEVNGVTSEAAHVYHPGASLLAAYRSFFRQWQLAFAIGKKNHKHGATFITPLRLLHLFRHDLAEFQSAENAATQSRAHES